MTLVLTVDSGRWNRHVDGLAAAVSGLVPVVKGNGYGFGRDWLADRAATLAPVMAVGTIHEVASVPSNYTAVVLTPSLDPSPITRANAVFTVGSVAHADALGAARRRVLVKVASSMRRYGVAPAEVAGLVARLGAAGHRVDGVSIHPPLTGTSADHRAEIESSVAALDPDLAVWVSHLDLADYDALRAAHPTRQWHLRLGTALWHGDKSTLALSADVIETRRVRAGDTVGYRGSTIAVDGTLVMVGCGSAHGVQPLADGRSPFHFGQRRLDLVEAPHMHTSMCLVADDAPTPTVGDRVDVQRPLTTTFPDVVSWQ